MRHIHKVKSQRFTTLLFQVGEVSSSPPATAAGDDPATALIPYIRELFRRNPEPQDRAALAALGVTAETLSSDQALGRAGEHIFPLMRLWAHACGEGHQFEEDATQELHTMWERLSPQPGEESLFTSVFAFAEVLGSLLNDLAYLIRGA